MVFWSITLLLILLAGLLVIVPLLQNVSQQAIEDRVEVSEQQAVIENFKEQINELDSQMDSGLLSRNDAEPLKQELQQKLLDEVEQSERHSPYHQHRNRALAVALLLSLPLLVIPLYWYLGAGTELQIAEAMKRGESDALKMQNMLEGWAQKKPESDQALYLLGSHYMQTGQIDLAINTYQDLFKLSKGHPQVSAELAQALFLNGDNEVTGEIRQLYERALRGDENNTTALGLKGIDAFAREDYQGAVAAWQQALGNEIDPVARQSLMAGINKARNFLGETVARIRVQLDLAPELKALPGNTRVILFARQAGTAQPPIVAIPLSLGELPREVILDDSASMVMGNNTLSGLESVDIIARISLSGDVMTADYQIEAKAVKTSANELIKLVFAPAG